MTDVITVRPAGVADTETLLTLVDALADYESLERPSAEARERLVRDGFGPRRRFEPYLAEVNGRVVAYAIVLETYSSFLALPTLYLEDIFVLPEVRRHGVGRALFRFLALEAQRRGCGRVEWMVLDWNRSAIDFYERLGARRLDGWLPYRLTRDQFPRVASGSRE